VVVGFELEVVVTLLVVEVVMVWLVEVVVGLVVVLEVVFVELVRDELELLLPPPEEVLTVDPISPQRMFEKTTWVPGSWEMMFEGLPSVLVQGPLLPLSSQFMLPLLSFQILKTSTMPRPKACPMLARPPNCAAELHADAWIVSPEEDALGTLCPFWT